MDGRASTGGSDRIGPVGSQWDRSLLLLLAVPMMHFKESDDSYHHHYRRSRRRRQEFPLPGDGDENEDVMFICLSGSIDGRSSR